MGAERRGEFSKLRVTARTLCQKAGKGCGTLNVKNWGR